MHKSHRFEGGGRGGAGGRADRYDSNGRRDGPRTDFRRRDDHTNSSVTQRRPADRPEGGGPAGSSSQQDGTNDRTGSSADVLDYFKNVEAAIVATAAQKAEYERQRLAAAPTTADAEEADADDQQGASVGPTVVLDGFCTELAQRLRREPNLVNHRIVARTIEVALSVAQYRHVQAIAFNFLGRIMAMAMSPTASFLLETLLASMYKALGTVVEGGAATTGAATDVDDDASGGMGGMQPLEEMLGLIVDELKTSIGGLLWDRGGAKCLSAALLVCGGFPVRSVPPNDRFRAPHLVDRLFQGLRPELLAGSLSRADAIALQDASIHVSGCFVVQALIQLSSSPPPSAATPPLAVRGDESKDEDDEDDGAVTAAEDAMEGPRSRIREFLREHLAPMVGVLMDSKIGTRVVERYASVGDPKAWSLVSDLCVAALKAPDTFIPEFAVCSLVDGCRSAEQVEQLWSTLFAPDAKTLSSWIALRQTADGGLEAYCHRHSLEQQAKKGVAGTKPTSTTTTTNRAPHPLVHFMAAVTLPGGSEMDPNAAAASTRRKRPATAVPPVSRVFAQTIVKAVYDAVKALSSANKGPAYALYFEGVGGIAGLQVLANVLRLGRPVASLLINALDKVPVGDLPSVAMTPLGSACVQAYVAAIAPESAAMPVVQSTRRAALAAASGAKGAAGAASATTAPPKKPLPTGAALRLQIKRAVKKNDAGKNTSRADSKTGNKMMKEEQDDTRRSSDDETPKATPAAVVAEPPTTDDAATRAALLGPLGPDLRAALAAARRQQTLDKKKNPTAKKSASTTTTTASAANQQEPTTTDAAPSASSAKNRPTATTPSPLLRFARKIGPSLASLARSTHGSFVVQALYAEGAIDVRECVCQYLANDYAQLKTDFIASKVCVRCCVEQFLYRFEEWDAQSARQAHLKKVMAAVVRAEAAFAESA